METSEARSAGHFFGAGAPGAVKACLRLASLERDWEKAAGHVVSIRTQPQSCSFAPDGLHLVVNVTDAGTLNSLRFRKAGLENSIASYLGVRSVQIEFNVGRVERRSSAKGPLPDHERRAPVLLSEEAVERERDTLGCEEGNEVAEALARLKAVTEKLRRRRTR